MKITHIGKYYKPVYGGMEKYIEDIVKNIKLDQEIIVSNTKNKTAISNENKVKITKVAQQLKLFSTPINLTLPKYIKNSDIFHLHLPNPMATIAYLIANPKEKLIITWHSDIINQKFLKIFFKPFQNAILKKADKIIVTSKNYLNYSKELANYKNKCTVIPIGINLEENKSDMKEIQNIRNKYKKPIVLFVGRLVYYKGVEYLIKAVNDLNVDLLIIGEGKLKNKLKSIATSNVHFLGKVKNLQSFYQACDMFVLPSVERSEAFGIVQLEAIKNKKPVISTILKTGVEYVNKKGILTQPRDVEGIKNAIKYLLNKNNNKKVAKISYEYICKNFNIKNTSKQIEKLYKSI